MVNKPTKEETAAKVAAIAKLDAGFDELDKNIQSSGKRSSGTTLANIKWGDLKGSHAVLAWKRIVNTPEGFTQEEFYKKAVANYGKHLKDSLSFSIWLKKVGEVYPEIKSTHAKNYLHRPVMAFFFIRKVVNGKLEKRGLYSDWNKRFQWFEKAILSNESLEYE